MQTVILPQLVLTPQNFNCAICTQVLESHKQLQKIGENKVCETKMVIGICIQNTSCVTLAHRQHLLQFNKATNSYCSSQN